MTTLTRLNATPVSDLLDWIDATRPFHTKPGAPYIAVDEFVEDGKYVVRADLPGIDPEQDVEVTIDGDVLTVHGERRESQHDEHRSEVRYGSFTRSLRVPAGCQADQVSASYDAGVLTVSLPLAEAPAEPVKIPIARSGS